MTTNRYRVSKKQWNEWTPEGQRVFNEMYMLFSDQKFVNHPKAAKIPAEHWGTIRWNAAWCAADLVGAGSAAEDFNPPETS